MPSFATFVHRLERHETSITSVGFFQNDASFEAAQVLYLIAFRIWLATLSVFVRNRAKPSISLIACIAVTSRKRRGFSPPVFVSLCFQISAGGAGRLHSPG